MLIEPNAKHKHILNMEVWQATCIGDMAGEHILDVHVLKELACIGNSMY